MLLQNAAKAVNAVSCYVTFYKRFTWLGMANTRDLLRVTNQCHTAELNQIGNKIVV